MLSVEVWLLSVFFLALRTPQTHAQPPTFSTGYSFFVDDSNPPFPQCKKGALDAALSQLGGDENDLSNLLSSFSDSKSRVNSLSSALFTRKLSADNADEAKGEQPHALMSLVYSAIGAPLMNAVKTSEELQTNNAAKGPGLKSLIASEPFAYFASQIFGYAPVPMSTIFQGIKLRSPMTNLVDAFCNSVERTHTDSAALTNLMCPVQNAVLAALACSSEETWSADCSSPPRTWLPDSCLPPSGETVQMSSHFADLHLEDRRELGENGLALPQRLDDSIVESEGFSMFLLFRAIQAAGSYTSITHPCGRNEPDEVILPGWNVDHVFLYKEGSSDRLVNAKTDTTPLIISMKPRADLASQCARLFVIRGTVSQYEWKVDFRLSLADVSEGMKIHQGFFLLASSVMPNIKDYLESMKTSCPDGVELIISGHSLGGALTNVLALLLKLSDLAIDVRITTVAFAAPAVFNKAAADFYAAHVNGRNLLVDLDPIAAAPCVSDKYPSGHLKCNGFVNMGSGFLEYHSTPGAIQLGLMDAVGSTMGLNSDMGLINFDVASKGLKIHLNIPPPLQVGVAHVCAYACHLSKYCEDTATNGGWKCMLKDERAPNLYPEDAYCPGFIDAIDF